MPGTRAKPKVTPMPRHERASLGRPLWKGSISFGLVNVPISLYSMERKAGELKFTMLDKRNRKGVRYQRINEESGEEVPWDQIVKGYEYRDDEFVVLDAEDFEKVQVEATQTIEITDFVKLDEIDSTFFDKPYIILPGKKAEKGYVILREALTKSGTVGISKVVIRTKEHLAGVIPKEDGLILVLMRFAHELKRVEDFPVPDAHVSEYKISDRELKLAEQLVASMTAKWKPEQYRDDYYDALKAWIEQKAEKGDMAAVPEGKPTKKDASNVIDLAELLRQSMMEKSAKGAKAAEAKPRKRAS